MKSYGFANRENKEWSNMWWENADKPNENRILLIGDSITNGYRSYVQSNLPEFSVDMLATSKALDDVMLFKELEYMFLQYEYKIIHFNNGLHGWHLQNEQYKTSYEKLIEFLKILSSNSVIVLVTSTPVTKIGQITELDMEKNDIVKERNKIVRGLADKYSLAINDLYNNMIEKPELRADDGYHYIDIGKEYQGKIVSEVIKLNI